MVSTLPKTILLYYRLLCFYTASLIFEVGSDSFTVIGKQLWCGGDTHTPGSFATSDLWQVTQHLHLFIVLLQQVFSDSQCQGLLLLSKNTKEFNFGVWWSLWPYVSQQPWVTCREHHSGSLQCKRDSHKLRGKGGDKGEIWQEWRAEASWVWQHSHSVRSKFQPLLLLTSGKQTPNMRKSPTGQK